MAAKVGKKASQIFVWIILGLLFIALAGFGIGSFGGSASRVGAVGDAVITAQDYSRALQGEIRARIAETNEPVNLADLRARGIDVAVLQGLLARAALSNETGRMGVSVGDAEVARQITENSGFQGLDGSFDRQGYEFALRQAGLSPAEFEEDVREDVARSLLQAAVLGGIAPPELFTEAIVAFQGETRDFSLLTVTEEELPVGLPDPTDDALQAHYDENPQRFTRPELRRITYAWVTPSMIMDEMEIDEAALRGLYDDRAELYIQPERRLVERLVFGSQAEAEAARGALDAGESDFDALVEARGLRLEDIDMGDVQRSDLSPAAAEAVFAETAEEIVGPVESSLGPALFRINAVLEAQETPFEEAREDLRSELAAEAARRAIDDVREEVDDLMAGGATLEELAETTMMELGQIDWQPGEDAGISGYDAFREAAALAAEGDFPELLDLSDGGIFALRLDELIPPTLPPLADVRDAVIEDWRAGQLREALAARAQALVADMATGASLEDLGPVGQETQIRRQDFIPDAPPTLVAQVFQLAEIGDTVVVPAGRAAFIARLDAVNPANRNAPDTALLLQIVDAQVAQSLASDLFEGFGQALEADAGITLDQGVINSVHATFP